MKKKKKRKDKIRNRIRQRQEEDARRIVQGLFEKTMVFQCLDCGREEEETLAVASLLIIDNGEEEPQMRSYPCDLCGGPMVPKSSLEEILGDISKV